MENPLRGWQVLRAGVPQLKLSPPNTAFLCQLQSTKTAFPTCNMFLERPMNAFWQQIKEMMLLRKHLRRQTKWPHLIGKLASPAPSTPMCLKYLNSPVSHTQFLPCKLFVQVVRLWRIVLNSEMQRVWRSNCTCRDFEWGKKVYTRCCPAKAEQLPHHPTTQETQNQLHFSNSSKKIFHVF